MPDHTDRLTPMELAAIRHRAERDVARPEDVLSLLADVEALREHVAELRTGAPGLIGEVLAQHRTQDVGRRDATGCWVWLYECSPGCGWVSAPFNAVDPESWKAVRATALRHEAEQIAEALRLGAPDTGSESPTTSHATTAAVPAQGEES